MLKSNKIRVGISVGDPNGIGFEIILKTFQDKKIYDFFIPIVFAHPKNFIEEQKKLGILTNVCSLTNLKKPKDLYEKLKNFGHHDEFDESGITEEKLKYYIDEGIVFYNHFVDQTNQNKWNYNYKLKKINNELLPKYLLNNKDKFREWFQN